MTTDPNYTQLRAYHHVTTALLADPDVGGDLLLVGLWLARATTLHIPRHGANRWSTAAIARDVFADPTVPLVGTRVQEVEIDGQVVHVNRWAVEKVHKLLADDRPHYDPWLDDRRHPERHTCQAPMIRRAGLCGNPTSTDRMMTDPATGRRIRIGACNRHRDSDWYTTTIDTWKQRATTATIPDPPANRGGILQRHIRLNWDAWWARHVPDWQPPATDERDSQPRRPQLTVLTFEPNQPTPDRATLGVIQQP